MARAPRRYSQSRSSFRRGSGGGRVSGGGLTGASVAGLINLASFLSPATAASDQAAAMTPAPIAASPNVPAPVVTPTPSVNPATGEGAGNGAPRPAGVLPPPPPTPISQPEAPPQPQAVAPAPPAPAPAVAPAAPAGGTEAAASSMLTAGPAATTPAPQGEPTLQPLRLTPVAAPSPSPAPAYYKDRAGNLVNLEQLIASWNAPAAATGTPTGSSSTLTPGDTAPPAPNGAPFTNVPWSGSAPQPFATVPGTASFTGPTLPSGGAALPDAGQGNVLTYDHGGIIDEPVIGRGQRTGKTYILVGNGKPERVTPVKSA